MGIIRYSNRGYLVNTVVARMQDFQAEVSIAGISDLVSFSMTSTVDQRMVMCPNRMEVQLNDAQHDM